MAPAGPPTRSAHLERNHSVSSDTSMHVSRLSNIGGQLIVVANRLPVSVTADPSAEGGYRFSVSSGGLASALSGCKKKMDFVVRLEHRVRGMRGGGAEKRTAAELLAQSQLGT